MAAPTLAADWGYDDPAETPAAPSRSPGTGAPRAKGPVKPAARGAATRRNPAAQTESTAARSEAPATDETSLSPEKPVPPTPAELAARNKVVDLKSWMEIYALAASSATEDDRSQILNLKILAEDTRKKLEKFTFEKIEQNVPEYIGIGPTWIPISKKISEDLDYKESYRLLFRALLRHAVDRLEPTAVQAELIQELLGPTRIAEVGPPVLTEEAINAYNDMTCFIYAKRHPEHSVEGDDNRQMFAEVIRQRYNDAPNIEAKRAMCKFDLTWATFRCRYLDASPADKDRLLLSMDPDKAKVPTPNRAKKPAQPALALTSPKLLKLFGMGPWAESAKTTPVAVKMNQMSLPTK
ncbi:MAG: hypothetical protein JST01_05410 [Cyanobacteria bacterium SZAS TMP-1]|nr:hypothetical protein [Cyanobacteria bacterium SZAS TMP-1]